MALLIAFIAGLLSFLSPCVLPIIPSYIAYIAGVSLKDLNDEASRSRARRAIIANSLLFILGFSSIFILSGAVAGVLGGFLLQFKDFLRVAGGVLIIVLGLYVIGVLKLPFLDVEKRVNLNKKPAGYFGSFLVGTIFAAAWVPCVGPILGSILLLAASGQTAGWGILLLLSYSLGLAVPFFLTSLALNSALIYFKRIEKHMGLIVAVSGAFLIIIGLLLVTNKLQIISGLL